MTTKAATVEALSLESIIQYELPCLLRRHHLNRDMVIGLIGDKGDGKSLGGALITLLDYMVEGDPCFSNMDIAARFEVGDETAAKYGLAGGVAQFASQPLDWKRLLAFAPEYRRCVIFADEINVSIADARRSMTNQNLAIDDVAQQIRKLETILIFTAIHEMFVESRLRDICDVWIHTEDTALSPEGLAHRKPQGVEFEWVIYPISRKLTGERYADTQTTLGPAYIHGRPFWGVIDTFERQTRRKYEVDLWNRGTTTSVELNEDPKVLEERSKWGWLYEKMATLVDQHKGDKADTFIMDSHELREYLGVSLRDWSLVARKLWGCIPELEKEGQGTKRNPYRYIIPVTSIERPESMGRHLVSK